jgi:Galactose oxidase, central domain
MTILRWIACLCAFVCLTLLASRAQSPDQVACQKAAEMGYQACLKSGIPCINCPPHKGNIQECLARLNMANEDCQPRLTWTSVSIPSGSTSWPLARVGPAYASHNGNFYMFGGYDLNTGLMLGDLWQPSPTFPPSWISRSSVSGSPPFKAEFASLSIDGTGNLWLFGGNGEDSKGSYGFFNSLWEYMPSTATWTLKSGPGTAVTLTDTTDANGVYGTQGVASMNNIPPARFGAVSWIDSSNNFWLYGGQGNYAGWLSDLWEYSANAGWTWKGGSQYFSSTTYTGPCGDSNSPGARVGASAWTDSTGKFWFFGGYGCDSKGNVGVLNDLWSMASNGSWTMVKGSATYGSAGSYGTQAAPAASNEPPARTGATAWTDPDGNLWLFGGTADDIWLTYGSNPTAQMMFDDLWEYKPGSTEWGAGTWTWIAGGSSPNAAPGGRSGAAGWAWGPAQFLLFGGFGVNPSNPNVGTLDDLWSSTGVVY